MLKATLIAGAALLLAAASAHAAVMVSVGSASIIDGTSSVTVPVTLSGGDNLASLSIAFAVGDGGAVLGGVTDAPIIAVTADTGIFAPFAGPNLSVVETPTLPSDSATVVDIALLVANTQVQATGLAFNVTIDTSNLSAGDVVMLHATTDVVPSSATDLVGPVDLSFQDGTLTVTAVPEPASLGLLALPALALLRRRSRAVR